LVPNPDRLKKRGRITVAGNAQSQFDTAQQHQWDEKDRCSAKKYAPARAT
jgi:hypothetical protein